MMICASGSENTKPTRRLTWAPERRVSRPSTRTVPRVGSTSPLSSRARVLFPEPFAPTIPMRRSGAQVRRRVGFVFSDPDAQIVMPTVAEDVAYSLRRSEHDRAVRDRLVADWLERHGLDGHADHPAHLLSGGQKQLLALTSVLVTSPRLVVADEPTTLLDLRNTRRVAALLAEIPQQVVLVSHDLDLMTGYDRVLVIDEGRVVADDEPAPAVAYYRRLLDERP